jgi:hypothetical protein
MPGIYTRPPAFIMEGALFDGCGQKEKNIPKKE